MVSSVKPAIVSAASSAELSPATTAARIVFSEVESVCRRMFRSSVLVASLSALR